MREPNFTLSDDEHRLTSDEAQRWLVDVISNPARVKQFWSELGQIDWWLLVLALMVNPSLRDEAWNAVGDNGKPVLDEKLKFWMTVNACENDGDAKDLVRHVVRDVVAARYRDEEVG